MHKYHVLIHEVVFVKGGGGYLVVLRMIFILCIFLGPTWVLNGLEENNLPHSNKRVGLFV